jgi:hypothetical protein
MPSSIISPKNELKVKRYILLYIHKIMPIDCLNDAVPVYDPDEKGCYSWMSVKAGKPSKFCDGVTFNDVTVVPPGEIIWDPNTTTIIPPTDVIFQDPPHHELVTWADNRDRILTEDLKDFVLENPPPGDPRYQPYGIPQVLTWQGTGTPSNAAPRPGPGELAFYKWVFDQNRVQPKDGEYQGEDAFIEWRNNPFPYVGPPSRVPFLGYGAGEHVITTPGLYKLTLNIAEVTNYGDTSYWQNNPALFNRPSSEWQVCNAPLTRFTGRRDVVEYTTQPNTQAHVLGGFLGRSENARLDPNDDAEDYSSIVSFFWVSPDMLTWSQPVTGAPGFVLQVWYEFINNGVPSGLPPPNDQTGWTRLLEDPRFGECQMAVEKVTTDPTIPTSNPEFFPIPGMNDRSYRETVLHAYPDLTSVPQTTEFRV